MVEGGGGSSILSSTRRVGAANFEDFRRPIGGRVDFLMAERMPWAVGGLVVWWLASFGIDRPAKLDLSAADLLGCDLQNASCNIFAILCGKALRISTMK